MNSGFGQFGYLRYDMISGFGQFDYFKYDMISSILLFKIRYDFWKNVKWLKSHCCGTEIRLDMANIWAAMY